MVMMMIRRAGAQLGISVIVPTHNRADELTRCLDSLTRLRRQRHEVIIVNDGSTDGTKKLLKRLRRPNWRSIQLSTNNGPSMARNAGIQAARHPIIACLDDDCLADPRWLDHLITPFADQSVGIVVGRTVYRKPNYQARFPERPVSNEQASWPMAMNIAYRKEALERAGGFNPAFDHYHNEDTELAIRILAVGFTIKSNRQALVTHQPSFWTTPRLRAASHNAAVWPILKRIYPNHYRLLQPPIWGLLIDPFDYLWLLVSPIIIAVQLVRYLRTDRPDMRLFFSRYIGYPIWKRLAIYRSAWREKVLLG